MQRGSKIARSLFNKINQIPKAVEYSQIISQGMTIIINIINFHVPSAPNTLINSIIPTLLNSPNKQIIMKSEKSPIYKIITPLKISRSLIIHSPTVLHNLIITALFHTIILSLNFFQKH